jgi:hypothetical protein
MPNIRGLSRALQLALINILALLLASPDLDDDVERRAHWLKWKLEGYDPAAAAAERRIDWLKSTRAA